jgi:hypothetical protein
MRVGIVTFIKRFLGIDKDSFSPEFFKGYAFASRMWTQGVTIGELEEIIASDTSKDDYLRGFVAACADHKQKMASRSWTEASRPDILKSRNTLW